MRFETRAIHVGQRPDPATGAVSVPVYQTSTFKQEAIGRHKGYEYSRTGNPTRTALEEALASLEDGRYASAFASGVAATTAVINLLAPGDHVILGADIYGGTYRLFKHFHKWGIETSFVYELGPDSLTKALRPETRLVWLESPTNPLLRVADIRALSDVTRESGAMLVVDNTFATPFFQQPLDLGADIVVHSTTKYLAGHSDVIGGAVICNGRTEDAKLKSIRNTTGAVPGPWDSWLVMRGLKTLPVRMRQHERNALELAAFLSGHDSIGSVHYPGLADDPGHATAQVGMSGFGGMLSFSLAGGRAAVDEFLQGLNVIILAESLGGVESLICYPAAMTHAAYPQKERERLGISDGLLRLSVGLEDVSDLKADLSRAMERVV